jgi:hypothetical protein
MFVLLAAVLLAGSRHLIIAGLPPTADAANVQRFSMSHKFESQLEQACLP